MSAGLQGVPLPPACYGFDRQLLRRAVARARRLGWATVAREAGRLEARRAVAIRELGVVENAGGCCWALYNQAEALEAGAALLDYAARTAHRTV
jgi:hypothetical protein